MKRKAVKSIGVVAVLGVTIEVKGGDSMCTEHTVIDTLYGPFFNVDAKLQKLLKLLFHILGVNKNLAASKTFSIPSPIATEKVS